MNKRLFMIITSTVVLVVIITLMILNVFSKSAKKNIGCSGGGCAGCSGCRNQGSISSTYYKSKEDKLIKKLDGNQKAFRKVLLLSYSEKEIDSIANETALEFRELLPEIPYIGGDSNPMTEDLENPAMALAFYRVMKSHGKSVEEVGNIICKATEDTISAYPKWLLRLNGRKFFSKEYIQQLRENAEESQKREYSGAWVYDYVEGDGDKFDYGYNHSECGIVKYFHEQNADELIPYMCKLDFIYSDALDEGLVRTNTIAEQGTYCDFRYKRAANDKLDFLIVFVPLVVGGSILLISFYVIRRKVIKKRLSKGLSS